MRDVDEQEYKTSWQYGEKQTWGRIWSKVEGWVSLTLHCDYEAVFKFNVQNAGYNQTFDIRLHEPLVCLPINPI